MADYSADDFVPDKLDVDGCWPSRLKRTIQAINQWFTEGTVNNSENLGGYEPQFFRSLKYATDDLDLVQVEPQPSIRVQLTSDMAKVMGEWQADSDRVYWNGSSYSTTGITETIVDPFKVACWSQPGDVVFVTPDIHRGVLMAAKTNSPTWYILPLPSDYAGGGINITWTRSGFSARTEHVIDGFSFTGTFASGTKVRIEFDIDQEAWVITEAYACPT